MAFLLMQDLFITALTQPCKKNEGHPRPLCCQGDWIPRAETCPAPPCPSKMQKSLNFLPSPGGWGCSLRKGNSTCGSSSRSAHAGWKESPLSSGMSQFPCPMNISFKHPRPPHPEEHLVSELPTPASLRRMLHGWFGQQNESSTEEWQPAVPLLLPVPVMIPWDALWSQEGMRTKHCLLQVCGSKMQTRAGAVRRLFGTEGAKPLSHSPAINLLSFPCCTSRDSFSGWREAKAKEGFQHILFQLAYPAASGKMLCV